MQFHTPPRLAGQIVEVAYASDGERIYRRTIDSSGPTGRVDWTTYPDATRGLWRCWWRTPDDSQAVDLDGGTYECATAEEALEQSEAEARRAVAERQLRIMPQVIVEAAPFTFEPWNEPPRGLDDWQPAELTSDGERWQPGAIERLDLDSYGALVMPPPAPGDCCWLCHPVRVPATHVGALCAAHYATNGAAGFARLATGAWVRLGASPERLDSAPIVYARDWPGARAVVEAHELGCECGDCDAAAEVMTRGRWLCQDCDGIVEALLSAGEWASGGDWHRAADEWHAEGFGAEAVEAWLAARCFDARAARALSLLGVTPLQAAWRRGLGGESLGYSVSNGDMSAARAAELTGAVEVERAEVETSDGGYVPCPGCGAHTLSAEHGGMVACARCGWLARLTNY